LLIKSRRKAEVGRTGGPHEGKCGLDEKT